MLRSDKNIFEQMNKDLHREIMKRSRLRKNCLRIKSQEDRLKHNTE